MKYAAGGTAFALPALFEHPHFITVQQNRSYDQAERGRLHGDRGQRVPSQWQMDLVHHPQYIRFAIDTVAGAVRRHNAAVEAKAEADASAVTKVPDVKDEAKITTRSKGKSKKSKPNGRKNRSLDKEDEAGEKPSEDSGKSGATEGVMDGDSSKDADASARDDTTAGQAKPTIHAVPAEVVSVPEKVDELGRFDLKYRIVCTHSSNCTYTAWEQSTASYVQRTFPDTWENTVRAQTSLPPRQADFRGIWTERPECFPQVSHVARHYISAQDARETIIKASALQIVSKPPPLPIPAYVPPAHGAHYGFGGYDSYDSDFGIDSDTAGDMLLGMYDF